MSYVGDFDPAAFDPADPATWPQPAPYAPGQWWYCTGPGIVGGVSVSRGDRVYPLGTGRRYGELAYGGEVFGGPIPSAPWDADPARVSFTAGAWSSAPGWQRPPAPYAGVPFGSTGWRLCVEVYELLEEARTFGDDAYGSGVYGDSIVVGTPPPATAATYNYRPGSDDSTAIARTFGNARSGDDPGTAIDPVPTSPGVDGDTIYVYAVTSGDNTVGIWFEQSDGTVTPRADMEAAWLAETGEAAGTGSAPDWPRNLANYKVIPNPPTGLPQTATIAEDWRDVTCPVFGAVIRRGSEDGTPFVDVDALALDLVDADAVEFPLLDSGGEVVREASASAPVRVALISPTGEPFPLFTGRIDRFADVADRPPRLVAIEAFGMVSDLVLDADVLRPVEAADDRGTALLDLAAYAWGSALTFGSDVLRPVDPATVQLRELLDLTAISVARHVRTNGDGVVRSVPWPLDPTGAPVEVTDRIGAADLAAVSVSLLSDTDVMLNDARASVGSVEGLADFSAVATDPASISRHGRRATGIGWPLSGLACDASALQSLADAASDRYGDNLTRVASIEVDTMQDPRWIPILADLDAGRPFTINLTRPIPRRYSGLVTGHELRITPGRISATIYFTTT